jgi:hypothetical protein
MPFDSPFVRAIAGRQSVADHVIIFRLLRVEGDDEGAVGQARVTQGFEMLITDERSTIATTELILA